MNWKDLFDAFFEYMSTYGLSSESIIVGFVIIFALLIFIIIKTTANDNKKAESNHKNVIGVNMPFAHSDIGDNNIIITGDNNIINDEAKIKKITDEGIKENNKNYLKAVVVDSNNKVINNETKTIIFKRK